ncbi:hypothetical protein ACOJIU_17795 (plasmid) [Carnobacterium maltaromaticum]|uniref:hypothetical protein n=1 Tax=Carnobacterium maltaromaticum TaxID=2751 RepID=UPI00344D5867
MNKEAFYINDDGSWDMSKSKWIAVPDNDNGEELTISVNKPYTLIPPPQPNYDPHFYHENQEWIEKGEAPEEPEEPEEPELDEKEILEELAELKEKVGLLEKRVIELEKDGGSEKN